MIASKCKLVLYIALVASFFYGGLAHAQTPTITGISPSSGPIGTNVTISGSGFGATQGSSAVSLNGTNATIFTWSDTSIVAIVPIGSTSGQFSVTVNGQPANSSSFTVTALPSSWSDSDIGSVGLAGSATYANGTFTVKGAGSQIWSAADSFHFAYQPLSGDGTIVARVVSVASVQDAGVMIRETLNSNATNAFTSYQSGPRLIFQCRPSTSGGTSQSTASGNVPYWVKLVRTGSTFSGYTSLDGVNWSQVGTSQTISMATNVYFGLAVESGNTSTLGTATFDNVSVSSTSALAPVITSLSATSGPIGDPIGVSGSGFGSTQGSSVVILNGTQTTINTWSNTFITTTIPTGAVSGPLSVLVGPSMTASNPVEFTVTSQPLPSTWLDSDIGITSLLGSATYANGTFTVNGGGSMIGGTADSFQFAYQPLSGDGTIVARLVSVQGGGGSHSAGIMIRETLASGATEAVMDYPGSLFELIYRATTGANAAVVQGSTGTNLPYWAKLVRVGNTFSGYTSPDGVNWTQVGTTQTISMATNVYIGLGATAFSTTALATAIFDNVSINSTAAPAPVITSLSATTGMIGSQVVIGGSHFGVSVGSSLVLLNALPMTINSWSDTSISATVPTGATSGPLVAAVGPSMNVSNHVNFTVTSMPLPSTWLDSDIGITSLLGSATYANGTFTVNGGGSMIGGTADSFQFAYQPLSGDGTIVARLVSVQGGGGSHSAGIMIRETLASGATEAVMDYPGSLFEFIYRATTGANAAVVQGSTGTNLPYWAKLVRVGNTFSGYTSPDGVNWTQVGTTQTISMATNVYIGLGVTAFSTTALATAIFDNVSINSTAAPAPVITSLSATTGMIGSQVVIGGSHFGVSAGSSLVLLNALPMTINSWSDTSISATVPTGATSGPLVAAVGPSMNVSNHVNFTVTSMPLPSTWLDSDIGITSLLGSATYANGTFTVNGGGSMIGGTADSFQFAYQPLSGDGTIVARLVSVQGGGGSHSAGIMIRETLASGATEAVMDYPGSLFELIYRATTGANAAVVQGSTGTNLPYWAKLVRVGNTFSGYTSPDGVNWTQVGTTQTISMATNVYIGLGATAFSTTALATAIFDNVSINSTAAPAPVITSLSATTGTIGTSVTLSGANFGASQGSSFVALNGVPMTVTSWSATSVTVTIASGASSGNLVVCAAPSMNNSNPVYFTVTTNPLPSGWLDLDVGSVGATGSAGYASGTFTVTGAGGMSSSTDAFHFVYQTLSGDGTIVARLVSAPYNEYAGVMIRETTASNSTYAFTFYLPNSFQMLDRATTGGTPSNQSGGPSASTPYWLKLARSGSSFTSYWSLDGTYWMQIGSSVTISMATNVYIGLAVDSGATGRLQTSTFDNVSVSSGTPSPWPDIIGITPNNGGIGGTVTINGTSFGATQGSSSVLFNGGAATSITSWSNTQIVAVVPSTASTGPVTVLENGVGSNENVAFTLYNPVITSLAPPFGPVGGAFVIRGSGFGATYSGSPVQINGVTAGFNNVTWSDTSITGYVPNNATSGPVTVTIGGVTSNGVQFSVIEAATVTGISPTSGPVGTSVVITGTGFGPSQNDSILDFYGMAASTITSWSDTSITAVVPAGSGTGSVLVTVAGIMSQGPVFTVTNTTTLTDSLGNSTTYSAEIVGGQWVGTDSQGSGCSTCTLRGTIHRTYDSRGNALSSTDSLGIVTMYTYDTSNNLSSQSVPLNGTTNAVTSYTYNSFGEVLTVTDPLGHVTTNTYDTHGNLLTVTSPAPNGSTAASVTTFTYNSLGELLTITDPLSHVTTMTYTTAGLSLPSRMLRAMSLLMPTTPRATALRLPMRSRTRRRLPMTR